MRSGQAYYERCYVPRNCMPLLPWALPTFVLLLLLLLLLCAAH